MWSKQIGDRNGDFILAKREQVAPNLFRDTWLLDPVVTLLPDTVTNKAFKRFLSNQVSPFSSPDNATTEFDSADYANVQTEDGLFASISAQATTIFLYANVAQLFTFDTSGYSNISDITCVWKGRYRSTPPGTIPDVYKVQIYKATAWEDWVAVPATNTEYSKSIGNGSAYFYSTTWIRFGAYMYIQSDGTSFMIALETDYAALQITYGVVVTKQWVMDGYVFIEK